LYFTAINFLILFFFTSIVWPHLLPVKLEDLMTWIAEGCAEIDHDILQECVRRLNYEFYIAQPT
jgi:hypothetical protein